MEEIILSYNLVFPILTINDGVDDDDSIIDGRDSPSSLTSFLQHYGTEEKVFAYRYVYAGCRRRSGRSSRLITIRIVKMPLSFLLVLYVV